MAQDKNINLLGGVLDQLAVSRQWRQRLALHTPFLIWEELVGEQIAAVAQPEVIREGVLWLRVADPVWRQQLVYEKTELLRVINRRLQSEEKISDLRFRLDPALEREVAAGKAEPQPTPGRPARPDPERERHFSRLLAGLDDPEARANMLRLWRKAEKARGEER